jgi:hypothetical protein
MGQPVGTPQGSPVSPVLSAIYTAYLLMLPDKWNNSSLAMYVDDRRILVWAEDWESVNRLLIERYRCCEAWLRMANLAIEPDKSEVIYFCTPCQQQDFPPNHIHLPNPSENTSYTVQASDMVRYLGFFINHKLDWEPHVTIMCNCAQASLKALQVLGSSHRGLSMANWRLVFNVVCLPVLTYGCQLWANASNLKSLMKKVLGVNKGVKVISGAFRTAPQEPLHEFLQILPACHFIEKLTHTSALRLYRVPRESQLLSRLGHEWDPSVQTGVDWVLSGPLNTTSRNRSGHSTQRPTALEALGARVPAEAPCTDIVAIAPWEVPNWGARLHFLDRTHPAQRRKWVDDLYGAVTPTSGAIIRVAGTISNKDRPDNRMVGACAAVLSQGGDREDLVRSWCVGTEMPQFDIDMMALAHTAEWIVSHFTTQAVPPSDIYILSNSLASLQAIDNTHHLESQQAVLLFHKSLSFLFSAQDFRDTKVHIVWAPVHQKRKQDTRARSRALEACTIAPLSELNHVQSAAYLKQMARLRAYREWAGEWEVEHILRDHNHKPDHFVYGWSILKPPDGGNNPVWRGIVTLPAKSKGKIPHPSRHTTSTLLHFAVGHGFFTDYSSRFRKDLPPESHYCPYGNGPRNMLHLMYYCPRHDHIRAKREFAQMMHHTSPDQFFTEPEYALTFAQFLSEGRVSFKPEEGPIVEYCDGLPLLTSAPRPSGSSLLGTARGLPAIPRSGLRQYAPPSPFDPG